MADQLKVAWFDGTNITQAHFEQQERYFQRNIDTKTMHTSSHLYGILEIEFKELLDGKIALQKISGIAQDGSIFQAPTQDLLPEPLEISYDTLENAIIVLKVQTSFSNLADLTLQNTLPNSQYICLKSAIALRNYEDIEPLEQNTALTQEKVPLNLASLRLKLGILGNATLDELEIPIAKIKRISTDKTIELDPNFIPTCLDISKVPVIRNFLEENLYAIKQHKAVLSNIFKGIDQTKNTLDFSTYLSLNLLKKWFLIFSHLLHKEKLHPESLYETLLQFQGDLEAFNTEDTLNFIPYYHNALDKTFTPLMQQLRVLFSKITSPRYTMAQVVDNGNGFYDLFFDNAGILENARLYLAISADVHYDYLLQNFKIHSKIHTQSKIKNIVATQLQGLNIQQVPNIPSSIPYLNGYVYYELDKKDALFADFKGENIISLYLTNTIKNPDIKMWAVF